MKKCICIILLIILLIMNIIPNYIYAKVEYDGLYKKTINTILEVGNNIASENFALDRAMDKYGTTRDQTSKFKEWSDSVIKIMDKGLPDSKDIIDTSGELAYNNYKKNKKNIAQLQEFVELAIHGMTAMITASTTYGQEQISADKFIDPQTGNEVSDKIAYFFLKYSGVRIFDVGR